MIDSIGKLFNKKNFFSVFFLLLNFVSILSIDDAVYSLIYGVISLFFYELVLSSYKKSRTFLLLILTIIWFKFNYIPILILSNFDYNSPFGYIEDGSYLIASIYALMLSYVIRGAYVLSNVLIKNEKPWFAQFKNKKYLYAKLPSSFSTIVLFVIFSLVVAYKLSNFGEDFSSRLIQNQGRGFLHIFGFIGYFLALITSFKFFNENKNLVSLKFPIQISLLLFFGLFFLLLGYRGGFFYPLVFFFVILMNHRFANLRDSIFVLIALLLLIFEINWLTGAFRIIIVRGDSFSIDNFLSSYQDYKSMYLIPMAFNHVDLFGYFIQNNENDILKGTYNTVVPTFFNWIPRVLYPDKELTTGARMAVEIFSGSITTEGRTSSITTGIVFESIYNYGMIVGCIFVFIFYTFVFSGIKYLNSRGLSSFLLSLLLCWNFGFSIFFDDLGGTINKFITLLLTAALLYTINRVLSLVYKRV